MDIKFCCWITGLTGRISNTGYQVLLLNSWIFWTDVKHWISSSAAEFLDLLDGYPTLDIKFCWGIPGVTGRISNTGYQVLLLNSWSYWTDNTGYKVLLRNSFTYWTDIQHWISSSAAEFLDLLDGYLTLTTSKKTVWHRKITKAIFWDQKFKH